MATVMVDRSTLQKIDSLTLSPRLRGLRKMFFDLPVGVGAQRAVSAMKAWQETEGVPLEQRHALKVKRIIEEHPVVIFLHQLIVGSATKFFRGGNPHIDYDGTYLGDLMAENRITMGGPCVEGKVTAKDWKALARAQRYFKGRSPVDTIKRERHAMAGRWYEDAVEAAAVQRYEHFGLPAGVPHYGKLIREGTRAVREKAERHIQELQNKKKLEDEDEERLDFWKAATICCDALVLLAHRYGETARRMAVREKDPVRKAELLKIADVCQWVPENPARDLHEAVQSVVFLHLALQLEHPCLPPTGWGHVDQYFYPFVHRGLAEGSLTLEHAADLLGEFLTYTARPEWVLSLDWRDYEQKGILQNISIGGCNEAGEDWSNELSSLFLHLMGLLAYAEPHVAFRWHRGTPEWLTHKALDTNIKVRGGVPQFQNSEHVVSYLTSLGVSVESARLWCGHGCSQTQPFDQPTTMFPGYYNTALPVDLVLHRGVASKTGKKIGIDTGDACRFESFEQFMEAYRKQCDYLIRNCIWSEEIVDRIRPHCWRQPMGSIFLPGCMEKGKDFTMGGLPHYRAMLKKDRGLVSAADSLMAVRKLVFNDKSVSMGELIAAMDANFEGERGEEIRRLCLSAPKFGNDIDEVDYLLRDIAKFSAGVIHSETNIFGYPYAINRNGQAWHFHSGKRMGALPNGRKAGEPLADGSISPAQGMDSHGPTALLKSVLKADFKETQQAILNMKFPTLLLRSPENQEKLIDLTESFFREGGTYIQYNILDKEMLLEAKRHPEQYKDLVVRVGGYSAYFVNLSPEIQDEIIRRTEQSW